MRISIRPVISFEPVARALARFILVIVVFLTVFAALFPFDFVFPSHGLWREIERRFDSSPEPATRHDRSQNMLFFVPFGIATALNIRARPRALRDTARILLGAGAGFALSMTLETLQCFLGFRDPTWMDVAMNTLGATIGAAGFTLLNGDKALEVVARWVGSLRRFATFTTITIVLLAYTVLQLAAPFLARGRGTLENWDTAHPLLLGNEIRGDRPWSGTISRVDLADRAASGKEVARIHQSGTIRDVLPDSLVASYLTRGPGPYPDQSNQLKPLSWVSHDSRNPPASQPGGPDEPAHLNNERWLRTPAAIAPAVHRIRQRSQFTLLATVAPAVSYQQGPARIVSISGGTYTRNISVMHERHMLCIRLRTPLLGEDGSAPEMRLDDVFDDTTPTRQIILTYRDPLLVVYIDGIEHGRLEIVPEAAIIWRLYPRIGWQVKLNQYGFRAYAAVYRLLVFIPFAALLSAASVLSGTKWRIQLLIVLGAIVGTALILELILGSLTASGFQVHNLLMSLIIAGGTVALILRPWHRATNRYT